MNGETPRGESKDGWKTEGCRNRLRVQNDYYKQ